MYFRVSSSSLKVIAKLGQNGHHDHDILNTQQKKENGEFDHNVSFKANV